MPLIRIWNPLPPAGHGQRNRESGPGRGVSSMAHRYRVHHRRHHHRRHRNPFGFNRASLETALWGVGGGIGSLAIPTMVLPAQNTGLMGYALNAASAAALKFVGDMVSDKAGEGLFIGGLVATGLRIVKDNLHSIPGLSGLGAYWQSYLPNLPAQSNPYGQMPNPNPPAVVATAGGAKAMSGGRFTEIGRAHV